MYKNIMQHENNDLVTVAHTCLSTKNVAISMVFLSSRAVGYVPLGY